MVLNGDLEQGTVQSHHSKSLYTIQFLYTHVHVPVHILQLEIETDNEDDEVIVLNDNDDNNDLLTMASVGVIQGLLAGNIPMPEIDEDEAAVL